MIHYHGTPITPRHQLMLMAGRHFCVSHADPRDLDVCLNIGQSLMLDNGAFSAFTRGKPMKPDEYIQWLDPILQHPHWAIIPDVIDGTVEQQRDGIKSWPYPKELSAPVWHLGLSIDYLLELCDTYPKVCLGSSGEFWQVGSPSWRKRMDDVFDVLSRRRYMPWIHGLRMLCQTDWPLASADSTNVARNYKQVASSPEQMASRIDAIQPLRKHVKNNQMELI